MKPEQVLSRTVEKITKVSGSWYTICILPDPSPARPWSRSVAKEATLRSTEFHGTSYNSNQNFESRSRQELNFYIFLSQKKMGKV